MNARRVFLVAALVAVGLLATMLPASACSCMYSDPRDAYARADAAIVGEYLGRRPTEDEFRAIYTFNVDEEFKADFGETLDVYSAHNGAACGLEAQPGQMVGLFLAMEGDQWTSTLCSQTSPEEVRRAASPLPEPDGSGSPRLIVGGSFGAARVMSLDADGKTLAYGYGGDHDTSDMDACPGGKHFVEIYEVRDDEEEYERRFAVRRVSDLEVVRDRPLEIDQFMFVTGLDCRDENASKTFLFVSPGYGRPDGTIYRETEDGLEVRFRHLEARSAAFGDRHVYLSGAKQRVWSMRLDGSSSRVLYSVKGARPLSPPALSENGEQLAVVAFGTYEPERDAKLALIDLRDGGVRQRKGGGDLGYGGLLVWDGSKRLVFAAGQGSPVYNLKLAKVGSLGPSYLTDAVVSGDRLWGISFGDLFRAGLPDNRIKHSRYLESPVTFSLIAVPN